MAAAKSGDLVEYYGTECHFCIQMAPDIEKLEKELKVKLVKKECWHNAANQADFMANFERVKLVWPRITGAQAPPDTLGFLYDFQGSLNGLAAAAPPKLDPAIAQRLVAGAQDVIDCIIANNP